MTAVLEVPYHVTLLWFFSCQIRQQVPTLGVVVKIKRKGFEQYVVHSKCSVNDSCH